MATQLPMLFEFRANQNFATFFPGNNAETLSHLQALFCKDTSQQIFLWGERGCGKTHLLQACCQAARSHAIDAIYLDFSQKGVWSPTLFEGLEDIELVCLDHLDKLVGNIDWEHALFNFYNRYQARKHRLLCAASLPPQQLALKLNDLKTRLNSGLTLKIQPMTDAQLIEAIAFKARAIGFDISPEVGRFLLNRFALDLNSMWVLLDKLDTATLSAKRKLTIPFLKQWMSLRES